MNEARSCLNRAPQKRGTHISESKCVHMDAATRAQFVQVFLTQDVSICGPSHQLVTTAACAVHMVIA